MSDNSHLDQVIQELRKLTPEELKAEMDKHKDDDIAVALRELNAEAEERELAGLLWGCMPKSRPPLSVCNKEDTGLKPAITDEQIAEALTYGSKWNHKKPQWLTRDEAIRAIKFSHGIK